MMNKMVLILMTVFSVNSFSALYDVHVEVKKFTFQASAERFTISASADSHERAFEIAAMKCMDYVANKYGSESEDKQMDIIDVCANPVR